METIIKNITFSKLFFRLFFYFCFISISYAQPGLPQRFITVQATQSLHFGTFALIGGNAGTVTVGYDGIRTSGDVFLSPISPTAQPAIFEVKLCQGRNVTITYVPSVTLTGSNGGSFTMDIGPTEKGVNGSEFAVNNDCNFITTLRVGGTLHIPPFSPAGVYSGTFEIIFEQE